MRSIAPGEELIYEFTTDYAGVWMYHCGTDPVLHHIANGMFGMVIVEPEGGLPPMKTNSSSCRTSGTSDPRRGSSFAKANQAAPAPDFVMFNGVAFQYKDHPIEIPTGERSGCSFSTSAVDRLLVPHRRNDLRRRRSRKGSTWSGATTATAPLGLDLAPARARDRAEGRRGRAVPDRHPRLQLPRPGTLGLLQAATATRDRGRRSYSRGHRLGRADHELGVTGADLALRRSSPCGSARRSLRRRPGRRSRNHGRLHPAVIGPWFRHRLDSVGPGPTGGYERQRDLDSLTVLEVVETIDGPTDNGRCVVAERLCDAAEPCALARRVGSCPPRARATRSPVSVWRR